VCNDILLSEAAQNGQYLPLRFKNNGKFKVLIANEVHGRKQLSNVDLGAKQLHYKHRYLFGLKYGVH
jgi:hypothetical protein